MFLLQMCLEVDLQHARGTCTDTVEDSFEVMILLKYKSSQQCGYAQWAI